MLSCLLLLGQKDAVHWIRATKITFPSLALCYLSFNNIVVDLGGAENMVVVERTELTLVSKSESAGDLVGGR